MKYIGAIDQGTTSSRFVIVNRYGKIISSSRLEHKQIYPRPGWVEHDPVEIWNNVKRVMRNALNKKQIKVDDLAALGITNQRETSVVWDPKTGKPYYNAIVWQDSRTREYCRKLIEIHGNDYFKNLSGLPVSAYFSGTKIKWLLDNVTGLRKAASAGRALFGNMDTWLIWQLTGGTDGGIHVTDVTNASRTMLMNLRTLKWDGKLLKTLDIPENILPVIKSSSEIYGYCRGSGLFRKSEVPVAGDLGDQQAALFGQRCFKKGQAKNTYGTGCFLLMNTGRDIVSSNYGLISTPAYKIGKQPAIYALEGSVAIAGSLVQWIRDNLKMIRTSGDIEKLAATVKDNGGVYIVPAFSGLFAPHWRDDARGIVAGLTHFVNRGHIARAALESTAYQVREIVEAMEKDSHSKLKKLKVDGGMAVNKFLLQFQADILGIPVVKPEIIETTVLGAAYAAGLAVGFWKSMENLRRIGHCDKEWRPSMLKSQRSDYYENWVKAVNRTLDWV